MINEFPRKERSRNSIQARKRKFNSNSRFDENHNQRRKSRFNEDSEKNSIGQKSQEKIYLMEILRKNRFDKNSENIDSIEFL